MLFRSASSKSTFNHLGEKVFEKSNDGEALHGKKEEKVEEKREMEKLVKDSEDSYFIRQYESSGVSTLDSSSFSSSSSSSSSTSTSTSFSYSNLAEAEVLCGVVQGFLDQGMELEKVRGSDGKQYFSDANWTSS